MSLFLRRDKIKCIKRDCQQLLNNPTVPVWVLSVPIRFYLENQSSLIQAAFLAPLHNHFLLRAKTVALRKRQSYETILSLDQAAQQELVWWRDYLVA